MKNTEKVIARGYGYTVYYDYKYKHYGVDTGKPIITCFDTLQGVAEHLYYGEYIPVKDIGALNTIA